MAGNTKDAWDEVGERFAEWGKLLSERYRERDREHGSTPEEDKRKLEAAVQAVVRQLDVAFTSLGDTLRDQQAKQSLGAAARSLVDAMGTTVSEVGRQLRRRTGPTTEPGSEPPSAASGDEAPGSQPPPVPPEEPGGPEGPAASG